MFDRTGKRERIVGRSDQYRQIELSPDQRRLAVEVASQIGVLEIDRGVFTPVTAKALIAHWCSRYAGKFVRIDVDAASGLPEWLEIQGLPRVDSATTMLRGGPLQRGPEFGYWALVTQALG